MSELYRCLACKSATATPGPNRMEDWQWLILDGDRRAGPFCTPSCAAAWKLWTETAQLESIFGEAGRYYWLRFSIASGVYRQDKVEPLMYRYHTTESWEEFSLLRPCPNYDAAHADNANRKIPEKVCAGCPRFRLTLRPIVRQVVAR